MSFAPPTARLTDTEAERLLLSAAMKELGWVVATGVTVEDFTQYPHRLVWLACLDLAGVGTGEAGVYSVYLLLRHRRQLADLGSHPARWLGELWFADPTGCWCDWAASRVKAMSERRERVRKAQDEIMEAMRG